MGSEWVQVPFNDLGEVNRGRSRHRPRYAEHLFGGKYPFIQTGDVRASNGRIVRHTQTYSEDGLAQSRLWPKGTMCITIAANIAETAILTYPACFPDSVVGFVADDSKCDVRFVEYNFRLLKRRLQAEAIGSVQDNINLGTLSRLNINLPSLPEQKAIAHILGSLDDKIELNRQMNETLEAMAQALFKSWFVDFDPVIDNALAAGNAIPETFAKRAEQRKVEISARKAAKKPENSHQSLFPSEFEFTEEMGWIPKGWGVVNLLEIIDLIGGGTPKTTIEEYWNGSIPWFSVVDAPSSSDVFVNDTEKHVTELGVEKSSTKILRIGTTIISARGTVGKCAMVSTPMAMNQSCYGIVGKNQISDTFVYYSVLVSVNALQQRGHGSVFNTITRDTFDSIKIAFSGEDLTIKFHEIVKTYFDKILSNSLQANSLAQLRDTLLPKLLSGELRIPDAEKLIAEASQNV